MTNVWDMSLSISSIDAKDLYMYTHFNANNKNTNGYSLKTKEGMANYKKYINSFDYSLDLINLREIGQDILPKKDALTFLYNEHEYCNKIINVTFKYSYKTFNQIKRKTYVKAGYDINDMVFDDSICVVDNNIIGVITDTPIISESKYNLPKGFSVKKDDDGTIYYVVKTIPNLLNVKDLRDYLYKNGFVCDGIKFVRFKRTSGSARVGKCLFIDERLYASMHNWEMCGLNVNDGDDIDLASLESYISLSASSIIDTIKIDPKCILIIPDYESVFTENSIVVEMDENNNLKTEEKDVEIKNSIFDGQSLIDFSIMKEYSKYGMILLRNKFFKSCCFNTNIQQWFIDNTITDISQINGFTLAKNISEIKLITSPSSIKYIKFSSLENWLQQVPNIFGIVKHEKKTGFFNGRLVQTHYQLLNTIQLSKEKTEELLKPSLDYVNLLNIDLDVLKYHIKYNNKEIESNIMQNKNEIVYTMLNCSDNFQKTEFYYDFKRGLCKSYRNNIKKGHILVNGNYSVLFGNPYEMLLHSINKFYGDTSIPVGCIHSTNFEWDKVLLGSRSPHISISNILLSKNIRHELIDKYFNLTKEIVCVNSIKENTLERLSGADFDSDAMLLTDNSIMIEVATKYYDIFKVPVNKVLSSKIERKFTNEQKADLDYKTSHNLIGDIVNCSQELNTILWEKINKSGLSINKKYELIKNIYYDICQLNIMSCIEIDKAKKEFAVSNYRELIKIRKKYIEKDKHNRTIKPKFVGYIAKTKGYYNSKKKNYKYHQTTMDYLIEIMNNSRSIKTDASSFIKLSECFKFDNYKESSINWKQIKNILSLCNEAQNEIFAIWKRDYYDSETKYFLTNRLRYDLSLNIKKMKINHSTMFKLLTYVDIKKYSSMSKLLFYILFNYDSDDFFNLLIKCNNNKQNIYLKESCDGDIEIYGVKYKKTLVADEAAY